MSMISGLIDELRELAGDGSMEWVSGPIRASVLREAADTIWQLRDDLQRANAAVRDAEHDESRAWDRVRKSEAEADRLREQGARLFDKTLELGTDNAKLLELVERLQPKDCEGNVLDIADTVGMLRSEYDGDHEWDDVVVELALTKWGGDRWIVRGSKGEAWACECTKTGYDEDAYEGSDDAEPIDNPTLIEAENAKLRELCAGLLTGYECGYGELCKGCTWDGIGDSKTFLCLPRVKARDLGVEVD